MHNLFTYGTLMCEDIMYAVSGYHLLCEHGKLYGYSRRAINGEDYPAIMPNKEAAVDGLIYRNIPEPAWLLIDKFEGEMYERHAVIVERTDGTKLSAETYVMHPSYLDHLDRTDWDFEEFIKSHKANWLSQIFG